MPRYKDPETGKIYIADDQGNIIKEELETEKDIVRAFGRGPAAEAPKELSQADLFYNAAGRFVPMGATAAGGIIGGIYGTPIMGGAAGAAAGSAIGKLLQGLAPQYLGEPPKTPGEALGGVTSDVALDLLFTGAGKALGMGFPSVRKEFMESLIPKWIKPTALSPEQLTAVKADPQFPFSLGQVNKTVGQLEDVFAPKVKQELVEGQNRYVSSQLQPFRVIPKEQLGIIAQRTARAEKGQLVGKIEQAYQRFEPFKTANTRQIKIELPPKPTGLFDPQGNPVTTPQFKIENVKGAIPVKRAKAFADQVGSQIDDILGPDATNPAWLGANTGNPLVRLKTELDKIRSVKTNLDPATNAPYADPIMSYDKLKGIRDSISAWRRKLSTVIPEQSARLQMINGIKAIESTIRADMDEAIRGWGPDAYGKFRSAQTLARQKAMRYDSKTAKRLLNETNDPEITYTEIAEEALKDPQKTRKFIAATGDRQLAENIVLRDAVDTGFSGATGQFDPDKILNYLETNKDITRAAVKSPVRTNMERLLRRAQIIGPQDPKSNVALKLRLAQGGVGLTVGAASMLSGRDWIPSTALAGGTVLLGTAGASQLMKKVVGNQRLAHLATGMLSAAPKSNFAKQGTRALMGLMKGAQIVYLSPDGREMPGTIGEDGKVILEKPE